MGISQDITQLKQAEEALRESEERFRQLAENIPEVFWLTRSDLQEVIYVSPGYEKIWGRSVAALYESPDHWLEAIYPEDRQRVHEAFVNKVLKGQFDEEYRIVRPDGSIRFIRDRGIPVPDAQGEIYRIAGIATDITMHKQTEEALQELNLALTHATPGISLLDNAGRYLQVNNAYANMLGYAPEDLLGQPWKPTVHPDDYATAMAAFEDTTATGKGEFEARAIRKDGSIFYKHVVMVKGITKPGGHESYHLFIRDITERKQAEEMIIRSRDFSLTMLERFPALIWRSGLDAKCNYFNQTWLVFTGRSLEEELGDGWTDGVHPEDLDRCVKTYLRAFETRQGFETEYRLRRYDGEYRWIVNVGYPFNDLDGEFGGYIGSCYDITEHMQAEEELEQQRDFLWHVIDIIPNFVFAKDRAGRFTLANQAIAKVYGTTVEELLGKSDADFNSNSAEVEFFRQKDLMVLDSSKDEFIPEEVITDSTGKTRWLQTVKRPLIGKDGKAHAVLGVATDITDRKKFEEKRLQARNLESIGLLAGGIAHDFNNLLTVVLGNLELFKSTFPPEAEGFHLLTRVEHASLRARDLTHQLLTFAKGGAPIKTTASISDIIKESADFVLRGSNVRCEFRFSDNLWPVEIDPGQISQVIQNVVINAQQAMPEGGVITICGDPVMIGPDPIQNFLPLHEGSYLKISISDQGTGISADALPKIFDPYFTTKRRGSGLGLASAYSIIKNHLGHITVESELGVGTTFSIFLPANPHAKMMGKQEESITQVGNGKILIMDDEPTIQTVLGEMLHLCGYEWEAANNGSEAIALFQQAKDSKQPYAVVILDLTVPGEKGGKEVIKGLLQIDPQVKAIVVSGYSNDPVMADFRSFGFSGVVTKPFRLTELSQAVHQVISGSTK